MTSSRRQFLLAGAASGAVFYLPALASENNSPSRLDEAPGVDGACALNAFITIATDGAITIFIPSSELGQGVYTSMVALVAEEMDADWTRVRCQPAPWAAAFQNPSNGMQGTGDSRSIRGWFLPLRRLGATTRAALVICAARRWRIDPASCRVENSVISGAAGEHATFAELAPEAALIAPPSDVTLKPRSRFKLIGRALTRKDTPAKVEGSATFGIDVKLTDMLYAAIAHPPFGGALISHIETVKALAMPGVVAVTQEAFGVAVVARSWWQAKQALGRLQLEYQQPDNALPGDDGDRIRQTQALQRDGITRWSIGDAALGLQNSATRLDAKYDVPFLAHAALEPMNATARVSDTLCEVWAPTQTPDRVAAVAQRLTGLGADAIRVHTMLCGGGFGRKSVPDVVIEAVMLAKTLKHPVQVLWSREEDMRNDRYRPRVSAMFSAGMDRAGQIQALQARVSGARIMDSLIEDFPDYYKRWPSAPRAVDSVGAISDAAYRIPHLNVQQCPVTSSLPLGFWRSVDFSHNCFFIESFVDELAHHAQIDALRFRRRHLLDDRLRHVMERAIALAGWPGTTRRHQGLALVRAYDSYIATVIELESRDGKPHLHRVICAVDCGQIVDRNSLGAQIEGGIVFGLSAAMFGEITTQQGRVLQSNFSDYRVLRINETPKIIVDLVDSEAAPGGAGELAVPGIAPALANAWFAATGVRLRSLPLKLAWR